MCSTWTLKWSVVITIGPEEFSCTPSLALVRRRDCGDEGDNDADHDDDDDETVEGLGRRCLPQLRRRRATAAVRCHGRDSTPSGGESVEEINALPRSIILSLIHI